MEPPTLNDVILYPDEYEGLVPAILVDGTPRTLTNRELEMFLAEAIAKLRKE